MRAPSRSPAPGIDQVKRSESFGSRSKLESAESSTVSGAGPTVRDATSLRDGRTVPRVIGDAAEARVRVLRVPVGAVLEHVERAVAPHLDVHRVIEGELREEGLHAHVVARRRERRREHPAAHPVVVDELVVVVLGEPHRGAGEVAVVIDRARHRRASAFARERELVALLVRVVDHRRLRAAAGSSRPCCSATCSPAASGRRS